MNTLLTLKSKHAVIHLPHKPHVIVNKHELRVIVRLLTAACWLLWFRDADVAAVAATPACVSD